nr:retrovirus-related Pol polyprotein from transposon TNT 1-94 [Tanacetum cinerariifolium]
MNDKMKDLECMTCKVKIAPHDYSKENFLATFTPQKQLTPEQIFWSHDLIKLKSKAVKEQTIFSRPIKALTVYPPNTPAMLVPRVLPTKSQVKIHIFTLIQLFSKFDKTYKKRITPTGLTEGKRVLNKPRNVTSKRKHDAIERKNLLIANDNLIAVCLSKEVFSVATNFELNVARFTEMDVANTLVEARCLALEAELANLRNKSHHDNQEELINHFSKLKKTNVPVPPSTGLNSCLNASGSQPKSNTKTNRILPAKGVNKLPVEDQPKTNKSHLKTLNRVDSSSLFKRTKPKQVRQVWKPTGKILTTIGHQWRLTGRIFNFGNQCPLTRFTTPKVVSAKQNKKRASRTDHPLIFRLRLLKTYDGDRSRLMNFVKKFIGIVRFRNDHFGAIMGYGDYVIGDNVISRYGVVERRNRTLVEAARTMLIFSKAPMFLWAEAVATACYTQNRSLIHTRHHKTPYELVHNKKHDLTFFRVFGALCYPTNDSEDLGKLQPTANIGIFVGYAPSRKGYRIYNKRIRQIMETIHVQFDELTEPMAPVHLDTGPAPNFLTPGQISSRLVPNLVPATPYVPPTNKELEILFHLMFDEYLEPPRVERPVHPAQAVQAPVSSADTPSSTTIDQDAPSLSISLSSLALQSDSLHQGVTVEPTYMKDHHVAPVDNNPFVNVFALEPHSEASSSGDISSTESTYISQTLHHLNK